MSDEKPSWKDEILLGCAIAVVVLAAAALVWLACGGAA